MRMCMVRKGAEAERMAGGNARSAELVSSTACGGKGANAERMAKGEVQSAECFFLAEVCKKNVRSVAAFFPQDRLSMVWQSLIS